MDLSQHAPGDVARDAAKRLLERFELTLVRIHAFPADLSLPEHPLALESRDPAGNTAGLDAESLRAAMRSRAPVCEILPTTQGDPRFGTTAGPTAYIGMTIPGPSAPVGFVECYRAAPFTLTVAAAIEQAVKEIADVLESAQATRSMESPSRGTILIADDDPSIRMLLRRLLTRASFTVIDVENGARAYQEARTQSPDLILLDWMMPVMDGRRATLQLKSDPHTRNIPVVMLTAQSQIDEKVAALDAGVQDFVTKPFDGRELIARVEQQLRWRRLLAVDAPPELRGERTVSVITHAASNVEPGGDNWARAVAAAELGRPRDALTLYLAEAEESEREKQYPRAAVAYRSASQIAGDLRNAELANQLLRLAGKMYLAWAESASDSNAIQEGYLYAARCFLMTGNLKLAKKSVDLATSFQSVLADDEPSFLGGASG